MHAHLRIYLLDEDGKRFFGEGPCQLLHAIESTGSLRSAALQMGMAYTKALTLIRHAEETLGYPLTEKIIGGKGGGGSRLTADGKLFLKKYERFRDTCAASGTYHYETMFCNPAVAATSDPATSTGCVIMASGMGKRFGSNKLLAPLHGKPLLQHMIETTALLPFASSLVVTRHLEVAALCRSLEVPVLLHDLQDRSQVIRIGLQGVQTYSSAPLSGCLFCPGDQPLVQAESLSALLEAAHLRADRALPPTICRLSHQDTPASPIWFHETLFPELLQLPQGKGGSFLAQKNPERVFLVPVRDASELYDVDTPEDLARLSTL